MNIKIKEKDKKKLIYGGLILIFGIFLLYSGMVKIPKFQITEADLDFITQVSLAPGQSYPPITITEINGSTIYYNYSNIIYSVNAGGTFYIMDGQVLSSFPVNISEGNHELSQYDVFLEGIGTNDTKVNLQVSSKTFYQAIEIQKEIIYNQTKIINQTVPGPTQYINETVYVNKTIEVEKEVIVEPTIGDFISKFKWYILIVGLAFMYVLFKKGKK